MIKNNNPLRIQVMTDSSSGLSPQEAKRLGVMVLPMSVCVDNVIYLEEISISRDEFFRRLAAGANVTTSQPPIARLTELWDKALADHDQIIYMPLSSGLSSSCSTAKSLAQDEPYAGRVFVVDNGRMATPQYQAILDALNLVNAGWDGEAVCSYLEKEGPQMDIYITCNTLKYLQKGGRISAGTAIAGTLLNIKPVLQLDTGLLHSFGKARGMAAAKKLMLDTMHKQLEGRFKPWADTGNINLMASGSANVTDTKEWIKEIQKSFPGYKVKYVPLSLAISSHTGEGALGIGCSCVPAPLQLRPVAGSFASDGSLQGSAAEALETGTSRL